jgi:hypothetical protein
MLRDGETTGHVGLHHLDVRSLITHQLVAHTGDPLFGNETPVPSVFLGTSDPRSPEGIRTGLLGKLAENILGTEPGRLVVVQKASDYQACYGDAPCRGSR